MWCKELKSRVLVAQPPRQCIIKTWENCQAYKIFSPISTCIKKEEIMIFTSAQYSCEKRRKEGREKCAILPVFFFSPVHMYLHAYKCTQWLLASPAIIIISCSSAAAAVIITQPGEIKLQEEGGDDRKEGKRGWASSHHLVGRFTYSIAVLLNLTSQPLAQFPVIPRCGYPSSIIIIITTIITTFYWH